MKKSCKKCSKELPDGRNDKLCEECRAKRKKSIRKVFIGLAIGGATITAAAVLATLTGKNKNDCDDYVNNFDDDDDYENDDDNLETINVWDAADIYQSSGFDEDYTFGYSHDELIDALD